MLGNLVKCPADTCSIGHISIDANGLSAAAFDSVDDWAMALGAAGENRDTVGAGKFLCNCGTLRVSRW